MKIKITYPPVAKRKLRWEKFLRICGWLMLFAAILCGALNLVIGGKAWSLIVLMGLYMTWTLLLSPTLVEYNRISQWIKLIACSCVLLSLINWFLAPGWAMVVVPLVCFCGLLIGSVLFFTDLERQKQNMLPMLLLIFFAMVGAVLGLSFWHEKSRWVLVVMGAFAVTLLAACVVILGKDFPRELRRRFHCK